nr:MAG TPA: hypothetical protein [Caudoviricetes sp.]
MYSLYKGGRSVLIGLQEYRAFWLADDEHFFRFVFLVVVSRRHGSCGL